MTSSRLSPLLAALALAAAPGAAAAQAPPAPDALCPALDEDFQLCANDPMSGNCASFVADATTLAQLFQIQADESPQKVPQLLATNWWGCGAASLSDMRALLARIGTPPALALLRQDPFARVAAPVVAPVPAPRPPGPVVRDCENEPTPDARDACAIAQLDAARSDYAAALSACQAAVAPGLRDALTVAEQAWPAARDAQCNAEAEEYDEPRLQSYTRTVCLATATRERTRAMWAAHPECPPAP